MFLFFHDIGFPWWAALVALFFIVLPLFVIVLRGIYILVAGKSRRATFYAGGVFVGAIILWLISWFTGNLIVETILMLFTLPFGMVLGFLHGDLGFYLIRDAILGDLNAAYHPVTPHVYLYEAFLNALAVANVTEIIERKIQNRNLKLS
ncbi:MAG: hypothetical protein M3033_09630 [Acidobacteriota bacterium]|nr:hypothetical protein [Acidobacteriota bacterium]